MHGRIAVPVVLFLAVLTVGCLGGGGPTTYNGTVVSVADGDTIDVRLADGSVETVRLLGVDTPEVHVPVDPAEYPGVPNTTAARECLRAVGENASRYVRSSVDGRQVRLELDPVADRRGGHGRLLAYVYRGDRHLNAALVSMGYARVYETEFSKRETFHRAEQDAMAADRGIWRCRRLNRSSA